MLERDDPSGLSILLTFSQIAFEIMHETVGYTYASWFEVMGDFLLVNKRIALSSFHTYRLHLFTQRHPS